VQKAAADAGLKVAAYLRMKVFPDQPAQNDLATNPKPTRKKRKK
jgi:hypothetical protein